MTDLVSIQSIEIDGESVPAVNARELHKFLEVKTHFKDWIKKRIAEYGFIEGQDFVRFELPAGMRLHETGGDFSEIMSAQKKAAVESMGYASNGQQGRIEYAITIDMGKELSMVERNAKGRQVRQYFIDVEKAYRVAHSPQLSPAEQCLAQAKILVAHERRLAAMEAEQREVKQLATEAHQRLDQIETAIDHFTIVGYAKKYLKRSISLAESQRYGRKATKLCQVMELETGEIPDPRFGAVKTYPKSMLDLIFSH